MTSKSPTCVRARTRSASTTIDIPHSHRNVSEECETCDALSVWCLRGRCDHVCTDRSDVGACGYKLCRGCCRGGGRVRCSGLLFCLEALAAEYRSALRRPEGGRWPDGALR